MPQETIPRTRHHQDIYRPFYTSDVALVSYMVRLLSPEMGNICLEPSAGSGCFIDGLLAIERRLFVRAIELSPETANSLRDKYRDNDGVEVVEQDFLSPGMELFEDKTLFDRVIANPPYGGWQSHERRCQLKSQYPELYVRETYSLFLVRSLDKLKNGGRAVFIIPDTFLYLNLQRRLRERIFSNYMVESIDIFPSSVFPGVKFGYARLCIISILNRQPTASHGIRVRQVDSLAELISSKHAHEINQTSILNRDGTVVPLHGTGSYTEFIDHHDLRLGDIADCVTGIYSGADTKFLWRSEVNPRGSDKYRVVDPERICRLNVIPIDGVDGSDCFVPLLKGGGSRYIKDELWYLDWSKNAVRHYQTNPKARFQNSKYYFRSGIGFPMVSSGRATAALLPNSWLFDQSIVGVFPKESKHLGYLLAFLNSSICWALLRQINPSANNSAKYLRKIPIIMPTPARLDNINQEVGKYINALKAGCRDESIEEYLDNEVRATYQKFLAANNKGTNGSLFPNSHDIHRGKVYRKDH